MPIGRVEELEGKLGVVHMDRQDMCGDCHACEALSGKKSCVIKCINTVQAQVGDVVEVDVTQQIFLKATYIMYGLPFVGLMIGLGLGYIISLDMTAHMGEIVMIAGAFLGMGSMLFYIKWRDKKNAYHKYMPRIVKIKED